MEVIDTLTEGFNLISKRIWLILLPIVLDLALWLGPQLSLVALLQQQNPDLTNAPPDLAKLMRSVEQMRQSALVVAEKFNLFSVLTLFAPQTLGVPSLMSKGLPETSLLKSHWIIPVGSDLAFYGWMFLLLLAGTLIGCVYWGLIAQQVRDGHTDLRSLWRRAVVWWGKLVLLILALVVISLILLLPTMLAVGFLAVLNQEIAFIAMGLMMALALWVVTLIFLYGFFFTAAFIIDDQGIWVAIRNSIQLVHRKFWHTLGLIVLVQVITAGLTIIWRGLTGYSWGTFVGIVGNAYAGSALVAASLIFYYANRGQVQQPVPQKDSK